MASFVDTSVSAAFSWRRRNGFLFGFLFFFGMFNFGLLPLLVVLGLILLFVFAISGLPVAKAVLFWYSLIARCRS